MNSKRVDLDMSPYHYKITSWWLLGFVEGDGSFYLDSEIETLAFSIKQKGNKTLMLAIKNYLDSLAKALGLTFSENTVKVNSSDRGTWKLRITDLRYLELVVIPLFESLIWYSKNI